MQAAATAAESATAAEPATDAAEPALEALYRDHAAALFHAAYRVTGDAGDAEDVLQSVFLRLARRPGGPGVREPAGPYLRRAAVHAALDLVRGRRRRSEVDLSDAAGDPAGEAGSGAAAAGTPDATLRRALRRALSRLTPESAEIFVLHHLEGYAYREIAALTGLSVSAVGVRLHRARHRLQRELEGAPGGPR